MAIRVLHCITALQRGGAEQMLLKLLRRIDRSRFESGVVQLHHSGPLQEEIRAASVPVWELGIDSWFTVPRGAFQLNGIVREFRPDIIQCWMYHPNLIGNIMRRFRTNFPPILWNIRHSVDRLAAESFTTRSLIRLGPYLLGGVKGVIYNSEASRNQHEGLGYDKVPSHVIGNGFSLEQMRCNPEEGRAIRTELGFEPTDFVVAHIARLHPFKNHAGALRVFSEFAAGNKNAKLLLVGREVESSSKLRALMTDSLERDGVAIVGERTDISALLSASDVCILPSLWGESFPNVLGEAMCCEVPVLAYDVGGVREFLPADSVVPLGDEVGMVEALRKLENLSPDERRMLGSQGREKIERSYSIEKITSQYERLYEDTLRSK